MTPQELQKVLDELQASRSSRRRAWENLQELRWVLQDSAGMKLPPPAKKTIDLEGRLIKDGVRKAIGDRQNALHELVIAINQYRKLSESQSLTLQGSDYSIPPVRRSTSIFRQSAIPRHMLALSTYMGHARLESTYWYLENTPQLMADIAEKPGKQH
jgi:hypothetical protein